ncbi:MAG: SRPBCC family protein, partial [Euryarchaeota archaeon]|nr:SRPBCC family protein [Euryarchaeota archaeon]
MRSRRRAAVLRFRVSDVVRATPEATFAWWTDLREDDAGRVMPPLRHRRIVRRTATEVETDDRWSIFGIPMRTRAVLRPNPPNGWEVISFLRGGHARDVVRLEPAPEGTRVTMNMEMELRWPWSWAGRVLNRPLERLLLNDLW